MAEWYDYQRAVWESSVPEPHVWTLLALAWHASSEGEGFPGNERLAAERRSSTRTVRYHTEDMEHHGLISKELRPGRSSIYRLNLEAIRAWDGSNNLAAWRKRPKRATPATRLPTTYVDRVAEALETRLPDTPETGLPDRGGNQVADITTRVNNPGTTSNRTSSSSESDTVGGVTRHQARPAGGLPASVDEDAKRQAFAAKLEAALARGDIEEGQLCRGCERSQWLHFLRDNCSTVTDSIPISSVPDVRPADDSASAHTEGARLVRLSPCDNHKDKTGRVDNRSGSRLCEECAPWLWAA